MRLSWVRLILRLHHEPCPSRHYTTTTPTLGLTHRPLPGSCGGDGGRKRGSANLKSCYSVHPAGALVPGTTAMSRPGPYSVPRRQSDHDHREPRQQTVSIPVISRVCYSMAFGAEHCSTIPAGYRSGDSRLSRATWYYCVMYGGRRTEETTLKAPTPRYAEHRHLCHHASVPAAAPCTPASAGAIETVRLAVFLRWCCCSLQRGLAAVER